MFSIFIALINGVTVNIIYFFDRNLPKNPKQKTNKPRAAWICKIVGFSIIVNNDSICLCDTINKWYYESICLVHDWHPLTFYTVEHWSSSGHTKKEIEFTLYMCKKKPYQIQCHVKFWAWGVPEYTMKSLKLKHREQPETAQYILFFQSYY